MPGFWKYTTTNNVFCWKTKQNSTTIFKFTAKPKFMFYTETKWHVSCHYYWTTVNTFVVAPTIFKGWTELLFVLWHRRKMAIVFREITIWLIHFLIVYWILDRNLTDFCVTLWYVNSWEYFQLSMLQEDTYSSKRTTQREIDYERWKMSQQFH